ncbi:hypothetical protein [Chondrinema litorale]|uniref:hypothetical protein n=1 Tax=Chondrinema litorale TaxID=2994555 RepID=UPI002543CA73|nr:hypothetical protein [Chondrinema litorale]UZR93135.1 hypothetical protein OQ292_14845 [Chondrinema litorale]
MKERDKVSSTFVDNMKLPIHGWFRYTAGFSAEWVTSVFNKFPNAKNILDPFVGSGTVLLEGLFNGKKTYGVEAHTLVHKIAEAKLLWNTDIERLQNEAIGLLKKAAAIKLEKRDYPKLLSKCYPPGTLEDLFKLKQAWLETKMSDESRKLTWFIITSILRVSSPVGTAQWQYILPNKSKSKVLEPYIAFENKLNAITSDMELVQRKKLPLGTAKLFKGDSRNLSEIQSNSIDLVITSPPYANNYDYADATRLELTFWEEIDNWGELQNLVKNDIIRACTQHVAHIRNDVDEYFSSSCLKPIRDELKVKFDLLAETRLHHGGKKNYHLMALAYFKDLAETFIALRRVCKDDSNLCFVIGDSAPYGIYLPVDQWLGKLAVGAGFNSYSFEKTRDRNVKWKNRKHQVPLQEGRLWIN